MTPTIIFWKDLAYIREGTRIYEIPDDNKVQEALHEYNFGREQRYVDIIWEAVKLTEGYKRYNKEL